MLFQVFGTENYAYRDVLEDIFDLGNELNTIKNLYKIVINNSFQSFSFKTFINKIVC